MASSYGMTTFCVEQSWQSDRRIHYHLAIYMKTGLPDRLFAKLTPEGTWIGWVDRLERGRNRSAVSSYNLSVCFTIGVSHSLATCCDMMTDLCLIQPCRGLANSHSIVNPLEREGRVWYCADPECIGVGHFRENCAARQIMIGR